MPFGVTQVSLTNHVLDGGPDTPREGAVFWSCPAHWKTLYVIAIYTATENQYRHKRECCCPLHCCRLAGVTLTFPREKSAPAMRPVVKIV